MGIQAVFDKASSKNYTFTHQLMQYESLKNDAYDFQPAGPAQPVGTPKPSPDLIKGCVVGCSSVQQSAAAGTCEDMCQRLHAVDAPTGAPKLLFSSVSLGPVMQEVRLQVSNEHKTRIRLWVSDDPAVGGRIELGHHIGVLEQMTEVASRFTVKELQKAEFYSEDNGYETIRHSSGSEDKDINLNHCKCTINPPFLLIHDPSFFLTDCRWLQTRAK